MKAHPHPVWLGLLAILGAAFALPASAPGQNEPEPWTLEQAIRVLRAPPWAQQKFILIPSGRLTNFPIIVGNRRRRQPVQPTPERFPAVYLVRWESAEAVAYAFERLAELGEHALVQFLAQPPPEAATAESLYYVVTVKALEPPLVASYDLFAGFELAELGRRAELKTSRGARVQAERAQRSGFEATTAVHFYFPRQVNAAPLLVHSEQWVEFRFAGERMTLKARFKRGALPGAPAWPGP